MRKKYRVLSAAALAAALMAMPVYASENKSPRFTTVVEGSAAGYWSDKTNLTWTYWDDGVPIVIGNGPKYSDLHPGVTDREALLKEYVNYPGEGMTNLNSWGEPKANYSDEALALLREFVNSFDWINSDELARVKAIHNRIACGQSGNVYGDSKIGEAFSVLRYKIGDCGNYAGEFRRLANYVGLECEVYSRHYNHVANMVNINGQWITVDPTVTMSFFDNGMTVPVDYETEYNRLEKQAKESGQFDRFDRLMELNDLLNSEKITKEEFDRRVNELYNQ